MKILDEENVDDNEDDDGNADEATNENAGDSNDCKNKLKLNF